MEWTSEPKFFQLAETPLANGKYTLQKPVKKIHRKKITKYVIRRKRGF
jgi:hypothetical protein